MEQLVAATKIVTVLILVLLVCSSLFFYCPFTKASSPFINAVWIQHTSDLLSNPSAFWSNFDGKSLNAIYYLDQYGGWNPDGSIYYSESDVALGNLLTAIYNHNSNIKVFFGSFADDSNLPDITNPVIQNSMCTAVNYSFRNFGGHSFSGFITDLEYYNGFIGNASYLIHWFQTYASNCSANGKLSGIYYGVHSWIEGEVEDRIVLSSLTVSFMVAEWDITSSYWEPIFYSDFVNYCSVPWQFQARTLSEGVGVQNVFAYFSTKFSDGVTANFGGFNFWTYQTTTSPEWSSIASILPNYNPVDPTPTPITSPTPTASPTVNSTLTPTPIPNSPDPTTNALPNTSTYIAGLPSTAFGLIAVIPIVSVAILVVAFLIRKPDEDDLGHDLSMIGATIVTVIIVDVLIVVASLIISGLQNSFPNIHLSYLW